MKKKEEKADAYCLPKGSYAMRLKRTPRELGDPMCNKFEPEVMEIVGYFIRPFYPHPQSSLLRNKRVSVVYRCDKVMGKPFLAYKAYSVCLGR